MGFVIYSVLTQRKWSYILALICSVLGLLAGLIPAIIADTNNFTEPFEMGSPHWAKTIASAIVLVVLVILVYPKHYFPNEYSYPTVERCRCLGISQDRNVGYQTATCFGILTDCKVDIPIPEK